jgi:hypothetical protein
VIDVGQIIGREGNWHRTERFGQPLGLSRTHQRYNIVSLRQNPGQRELSESTAFAGCNRTQE